MHLETTVPSAQASGSAGMSDFEMDVESILNTPSVKERERKAMSDAISEILHTRTAKEISRTQRFKSASNHLREMCSYKTYEDCDRAGGRRNCRKIHFRRLIYPQTDVSLGACSFMGGCIRPGSCKYIHYALDTKERWPSQRSLFAKQYPNLPPSQWICCDVRKLDYSVLGKYQIVMADPPWRIAQSLPYPTLKDDEMRALRLGLLVDDGFIFLWVTMRAMELGRECLKLWGFEVVNEIVWVKTNQMGQLARIGRTGPLLNHSKEHCLVGIKGNPVFNRCVDCDVIVAEVRESSRKPDEIYGVIERLMPGGRKLEIFGRNHNLCPGWVTVGNQLNGTAVQDTDMLKHLALMHPGGPPM